MLKPHAIYKTAKKGGQIRTATCFSTDMGCRRLATLFSKQLHKLPQMKLVVQHRFLKLKMPSSSSKVVNSKFCWCSPSCCSLWSWNQLTINKRQHMAVAFGDARHIYVSKSKRNSFNKSDNCLIRENSWSDKCKWAFWVLIDMVLKFNFDWGVYSFSSVKGLKPPTKSVPLFWYSCLYIYCFR